ncbi:hypothetical protein F2P45_24995 [Massilia sp. CCM 8733]|uniref:KfrA N-terminal DNA-binding domain-containing protein n=1 Tax=Massilia mucilaginosa TaxID=2609282 RepID=A0ABX0P076_9BURK|nr:DNA-binding protein [Massilia mucilaginosa]NHZ92235.1 hypothetical protein [Massilia mucilaginosa]
MARQEVTYEEVAAAAISLQEDGTRASIDAVRAALGTGSPNVIHQHLIEWRASEATPPVPPAAEIPPSVASVLGNWAQQFAHEAGAGVRDALAQSESDMADLLASSQQLEAERDDLRSQLTGMTIARDQALATVAERDEDIQRLTVELRNARLVATEALVGKAKDQLAIEGKNEQLVDLRAQIERNVASQATVSDARLTAEMELIGAVTARDNFEAEIKELRARFDASNAERSALRAELEVLRARQ